eukprot:TRINITY_DN5017_c0_g1_i7.p1 TRINITY_DN5017_c0_g1~~TRINITY_DN5017_c0_g1_i7.p1  ORF type:complete len:585 (+),score=72.61 TRINITY_DN5017_c0_g1_i7:87-1841(+)
MYDGRDSSRVLGERMGGQHEFDCNADEQWASYNADVDPHCMSTFHNFSEYRIAEQQQYTSSLQQEGKDRDDAYKRSSPNLSRPFLRGIARDVARPSYDAYPDASDLVSDGETSYGYSFDRSSMGSCHTAMEGSAYKGFHSEAPQECSQRGNFEASRASSFEQAPHVRTRAESNIYNGCDFWGTNEDVYEVSEKMNTCGANVRASVHDGVQDLDQVEATVRVGHMIRRTGLEGDGSSLDLGQSTPSDKLLLSEIMLSKLSTNNENTHRFIEDCANLCGKDAVHAASHAVLQKSAKKGDIVTSEGLAELLLQCGSPDALVRPLNILLGVYVKHGDLVRANYWWDRFVSAGVKPTIVTYNTMINLCVRAREIRQAEWWIERLLQDGVQPCHVTFTTLIKACGQSRSPDRAEYWYRRMRAVGLQGDLVLHNAMIDVYTKCSNIKRAEIWFYEMQEEGVLPCQRTFNMLVHACAKSGNMKRASMWHTEMHRAGYRSDIYTYGALLEGCARCADTDLADYYIQCMCREGLTPNIVCLRSLLKVYLPLKDATCLANRLTYCMRHCGVSRHVIDQALASTGSRLRSAVVENL